MSRGGGGGIGAKRRNSLLSCARLTTITKSQEKKIKNGDIGGRLKRKDKNLTTV